MCEERNRESVKEMEKRTEGERDREREENGSWGKCCGGSGIMTKINKE